MFKRMNKIQWMYPGKFIFTIFILNWNITLLQSCEFFPTGEYLRFVRIPEDFPVGERVLTLKIHNKTNLNLESIEKGDDLQYFTLSHVNDDTVDIKLVKSLENAIEHDKNILKFRLHCSSDNSDLAPNYLSISVFVEDINNHRPKFLSTPYNITVNELTPVGLTIFRGITAIDLDKPNTPNSDIFYSIIDGNRDGKFTLEGSHSPGLILSKSLDYDSGDREFQIVISATDRGSPPLSSNATVFISVKDNDDLPVAFKQSIYTTKITEFYPITNESILQELIFSEAIKANDLDVSLNSDVIYDIIAGNELGFFEMNPKTGKLFLIRQLDREKLPNDIFELTIRARQANAFEKFGIAKVIIEVLDLNENLPQFEHAVYNISIMENLPNGFSVLQVHAIDSDKGENSEFVYKLQDPKNAFSIDPISGWLTVSDETKLDREKVEFVELKVSTEEKVPNIRINGRKEKESSTAFVRIGLLDANDNSPTFTPSNLFHFQVTVDAEVGSVVGQVTAEDDDVEFNGNGKVVYEIQKSNSTEELPFEIDAKNGYIFLLERPLPKLQYTLLIEAHDQPSNPSERRHSLAVVQIDVVKAGLNHSPEFVGSPYEFWVGTNVGIGTSVGQIKVRDLEPKHTVYDLLHSYYEGVPFAIEERTGIIAVVDELTKFPRHHYDFEAYVTDSRHTLTTNVSIHVVDPVQVIAASSSEPIKLSVPENVGGAVLANLRKLLRAPGKDTRAMEFLLANYEANDKFAISNDGTIYTLKELDREEKSEYILTVIAQNRGVIQGQGAYQLIVSVVDENDNKPRFDRKEYDGHVRENSPPGTPIRMTHPVNVVDIDDGVNANFKIQLKGDGWDRFRVDPGNGKLYVGNIPLDREERSQYSLELVATDSGNLSSSVPLTIFIDDINDNPPMFKQNIVIDPIETDPTQGPREFLRTSASQPVSVEIATTEPIRIPETIEVGSKIARILAFDRDYSENAVIFYRIVSENSNKVGEKFFYLTDKEYLFNGNKDKHFRIDRTTGEISVSKPLKPDTEYALNVSASDRGGLRSYTGIKVVVFDVNNFQPIFKKSWYSFEVFEGSVGAIGKVVAEDGDSGVNGLIKYSIHPKDIDEPIPFTINENTGELIIKEELDREKRDKYTIQAVARDSGKPSMESIVDIQIEILDRNDNPPVFYKYSSNIRGNNDELIPVYRASILDNAPAGSIVSQVFVNDSDSVANGNGLVLLHLNNHHREFYIDSKNGTIATATNLDYEAANEYNLTVTASDLGKPSQSSIALVLVKVIDSGERRRSNSEVSVVTERAFDQYTYEFKIPHPIMIPTLITVMNLTEKYRKYSSRFEIHGDEHSLEKFRIDPKTGAIFLMDSLQEKKSYEFLVRVINMNLRSGFDIRQKLHNPGDRNLGLGFNEALIRVVHAPSTYIPPRTTPRQELNTDAAEPIIITKGTPRPPRIITSKGHQGPIRPTTNTTTTGPEYNPDYEQQTNSNFYAGEVAVLSLSAVIFLGGLIAAITVACLRKRRNHHRRRLTRHIPMIPAEVRLQKPHASGRIASGPSRPILFPMALPGVPGEPVSLMMMEESNSSDHTSDTYADSAEIINRMGHKNHKETHALHKAGYSICPDCHKLRKPQRQHQRDDHHIRDMGPMKIIRGFGYREHSLQSTSHDSGIDGSDGQCNCCQNHLNNPSKERENFEDSLNPQGQGPFNKHAKHPMGYSGNNLNFSQRNLKTRNRPPEPMVIL